MSWLTPLGFLGLISLLVLLLIYILKPNYQNKRISSTYIWKLSLRYKKKKIPINKLRNILLIICQALALIAASFILAQPFSDDGEYAASEQVIIIDASASMMAKTGTTTRFEKAINSVKEEIDTVFDENSDAKISIIIADDKAEFLYSRADANMRELLKYSLNSLVAADAENPCTYGSGDIEGAIKLSEQISSTVPGTGIKLYTDTDYIDSGRIEVVPVKDVNDRNIAILDVRAVNDENYFRIEIDVASYGANDSVQIFCDINGVYDGETDEAQDLTLSANVPCESDKVTTVAFGYIPEDPTEADDTFINIVENVRITSFDNVYVRVDEDDAISFDNAFFLYGGNKPTLRIQYSSTTPNNYFATAIMVLRSQLGYRWNIDFVQLKPDEEPAMEGFDIYIFEHKMPTDSLPKDGLVILADPDYAPTDANFRLGGELSSQQEVYLTPGEEHPITKTVRADEISLTKFSAITSYDGYTPLLYVEDYPVMIAKNDPDSKIVVMSFSLNYSNLALLFDFPLMMYNMMEYYLPSTLTEHVFDVNEEVTLGSRSELLHLSGPGGVDENITEFPAAVTFTTPGVYTVTQTPISGNEISDSFYIKVPAVESNINYSEDSLDNPIFYEKVENTFVDLIIYFAIALVTLLFAEWWLSSREQYQIGK